MQPKKARRAISNIDRDEQDKDKKIRAGKLSFYKDNGTSFSLTNEELSASIDGRISRSSIERDVSMILNHSIDSQDDYLVDKKMNDKLKAPLYDDENSAEEF